MESSEQHFICSWINSSPSINGFEMHTQTHTQESSMGPADMLGDDDGVVLYATDDIILLFVRKARGNEL